MKIAIIIILSLFLIALIAVIFYVIKKHYEMREKEIEIKNSVKYLSVDITDEKFDLLDKLIDREFSDFIKLHPDKFDDSGNAYINEEEYKSFLTDITKRVHAQLTPALKANISLVYNFSTDKEQLTIILEKVGVMLAMYRAKINNAVIDDTDNLKSTTNIL